MDFWNLTTGNAILNAIIATVVQSLLIVSWNAIRKQLRKHWHRVVVTVVYILLATSTIFLWQGVPGLGVLLIIIVTGAALFLIYRDSIMWIGSGGQSSANLRELKTILGHSHDFAKPALTFFAVRSVAHLLAGTPSSPNRGPMVDVEDYIRVLEDTINMENLAHVLIFTNVSPSDWGDPDTCASSKQKKAWAYFRKQEKVKKAREETDFKLGIRRYLCLPMGQERLIKNSAFAAKHEKANIDLYLLDPEKWLEKDMRSGKKDYIFFFDKFGRGWNIYSEFDTHTDNSPSSSAAADREGEFQFCEVLIECNPETLRNRCTAAVNNAETYASEILKPHYSNRYDDEWRRKARLAAEPDV